MEVAASPVKAAVEAASQLLGSSTGKQSPPPRTNLAEVPLNGQNLASELSAAKPSALLPSASVQNDKFTRYAAQYRYCVLYVTTHVLWS